VVTHSTNYSPLFGLNAGERVATGASFFAAVHPDDRERVHAALADAQAGRADYAVECRIVQPDGSLRWMADRGDVLRDTNGAPIAMIGVARDFTLERQREEAVRASEARLRLALEAAQMGTWEWDAAAGTATYSDTFGPLVGQPAGWAPAPGAFLTLVPEDDRARVAAAMFGPAASDAASDAAPADTSEVASEVAEFRVRLPDGGVRHLVAHAARRGGGRVVGALADAPSGCGWRSSCGRRRRWRRSGSWPAGSRTTSTTCSPSSAGTWASCAPTCRAITRRRPTCRRSRARPIAPARSYASCSRSAASRC
jgi:PAS domain S-box-containing protein